jgi:hypothetical protein
MTLARIRGRPWLPMGRKSRGQFKKAASAAPAGVPGPALASGYFGGGQFLPAHWQGVLCFVCAQSEWGGASAELSKACRGGGRAETPPQRPKGPNRVAAGPSESSAHPAAAGWGFGLSRFSDVRVLYEGQTGDQLRFAFELSRLHSAEGVPTAFPASGGPRSIQLGRATRANGQLC